MKRFKIKIFDADFCYFFMSQIYFSLVGCVGWVSKGVIFGFQQMNDFKIIIIQEVFNHKMYKSKKKQEKFPKL